MKRLAVDVLVRAGIDRDRAKISKHVHALVERWTRGAAPTTPTASSINSGLCGAFDEALREELWEKERLPAVPVDSGDVTSASHGVHAWTWYGGLHYDAEAPNGVEDWRSLPFWLRWSLFRPFPKQRDDDLVMSGKFATAQRLYRRTFEAIERDVAASHGVS